MNRQPSSPAGPDAWAGLRQQGFQIGRPQRAAHRSSSCPAGFFQNRKRIVNPAPPPSRRSRPSVGTGHCRVGLGFRLIATGRHMPPPRFLGGPSREQPLSRGGNVLPCDPLPADSANSLGMAVPGPALRRHRGRPASTGQRRATAQVGSRVAGLPEVGCLCRWDSSQL